MNEIGLTKRDFKCDYPGCFLLPFAEMYPPIGMGIKGWGWFYFCLPHFLTEYALRKNPRIGGWSLAEWLSRLPLVKWLWEVYCTHSWLNERGEE